MTRAYDDRIAEFVLDTPIMRGFVAEVQAAIVGASSQHDACATIEPRFAELLADSGWLPDEYQAAAPESGMGGGIGQWLLCRADDGSLSLFSLVVPPGSETPSTTTSPGGSSACIAELSTRKSTRRAAGRSSSSSSVRS